MQRSFLPLLMAGALLEQTTSYVVASNKFCSHFICESTSNRNSIVNHSKCELKVVYTF
ncbi:hypothetical protein M758_8G176100 [Ceratodon purpureus]|uniref:Secreted protein n=1 Tax=Ceratodon purpureus TaxID=3225 RepID=A0A8T0H4H7_CERPU|nr:hypothetical protein KC19_8G181200 [Ceratodon purpureus]KAG0609330.1 hypothetical protein M758_8G176100 [Ceratodon purpureus]